MSQKTRVGVIRGGPSREYEISLKTGAEILGFLSADIYEVVDILIDKNGTWHIGGTPTNVSKIYGRVDVVVNALHGKYGEDGIVQRELDAFSVPYTGSRSLGSAICMNKVRTKDVFRKAGLRTPASFVLKADDNPKRNAVEAFQSVPSPFVIKPVKSGSSFGVYFVDTLEEMQNRISRALVYGDEIMVEERIHGREATCAVCEDFRGEELYAFPPTEIIPAEGSIFFDHDAKYSGASEEICPGNFTQEESAEIKRLALEAHHLLGLEHYSRSDFIVSPRGIYILEVNSLPGLTRESLFPKSLEAVGSSMPEFLEHIISLAMNRGSY